MRQRPPPRRDLTIVSIQLHLGFQHAIAAISTMAAGATHASLVLDKVNKVFVADGMGKGCQSSSGAHRSLPGSCPCVAALWCAEDRVHGKASLLPQQSPGCI